MGNFWDFLRPLSEAVNGFLGPIVLIGLVISIIIFAIAIKSYLKTKSRKLLFIAVAFLLFLVKWVIQAADLFWSPGIFFGVPAQSVAEILIMVFILLAVFRK
ncbi:MAG: hypothetical protein PHH08_01735 [Candidatus ainarchaeum sp.]|nr:hypothetical protein [Candidatus ainarchaeum sp.]